MELIEYLDWSNLTWMLIAAVISVLWIWTRSRKTKNLPPGPPAFPIIGSFLSMAGPDTRATFQNLRKKYGDVFRLHLGSTLVIVFNGYDTLKEAFVKNGELFNDRHKGMVYDELTKRIGIINGNGQMWKAQRKFSLSVLRDLGVGKNVMETRILDEVSTALNTIKTYNGAAVDVQSILRIAFYNIITSLTLGQCFPPDDPEFNKCAEMIDKSMEIVGGTSIGNFFPILKHCPGDPLQYKYLAESNKICKAFIKKQVQLHHTDEMLKHSEDFVNAYLKEMERQKAAKETDSSFNEDTLVSIVVEFFVAGVETTTTTLRWALLYLALNPDIQEKAHKELDQVLEKDQLPSMADKQKLPYMEALVTEVQRISDVSPFSVPHGNPQTVSFRGFTIPENSMLLQNISSVLMDPELWEDPETFKPERFLDDSGRILRADVMIPFSLGKRMCLGESLARMELFLFLVSLLKRFHFRLPEGASPPDLKGLLGATRTPYAYDICAVERHCD